jgi:hypothetical protein
VKLTVDRESQLRSKVLPADLRDFKVGDAVLVSYTVRDGKNHVVSATANPDTVGDVMRKVQDALQSAKNYGYAHKDEYAQKLQNVLEDVNTCIGQLKTQADKASAEVRERLQPQIDELRRRSQAVQQQLDKVKDATPAIWNDIRTGVHGAWKNLQEAFDKAWDEKKNQ